MSDYRPAQGSYARGVNADLPVAITKAGSKQTYYTFRLLLGGQQMQDACRAYAYFRWVDDQLDGKVGTPQEKLAFYKRQSDLLEACYHHESTPAECPEEQMLVDLIANDHEASSGLQFYLRNMMAVMSFDVQRRDRMVTQAELNQYSRLLSAAVTELLFYFLAHDDPAPVNADRYQAVRGAHITHMLRDLMDDLEHGYINLPAELLENRRLSLDDLHSRAFRLWVLERVRLAQNCFYAGRRYFAGVKNFRCRFAAFAYLARFEWILKVIERDGYRLRRTYPERKSLRAALWMARAVIKSALNVSIYRDTDRPLVLPE